MGGGGELPPRLTARVREGRDDADDVREREQGHRALPQRGMYSARKVQGVPVEFLVYEDERHVTSRPANQRDLLKRVIARMDPWLAAKSSAMAEAG